MNGANVDGRLTTICPFACRPFGFYCTCQLADLESGVRMYVQQTKGGEGDTPTPSITTPFAAHESLSAFSALLRAFCTAVFMALAFCEL